MSIAKKQQIKNSKATLPKKYKWYKGVLLNDINSSDIRAKFITLTEYIKNKGAGLSYLMLKINVASENTGYPCRLQEEQLVM